MLSRGLVHDSFTQDPADSICGEKGCAKWFIDRERIGNFKDAGFRAFAIHFGRFVFLYVPVQVPRRSIDLPGGDQNLELLKNREGPLNRITGIARVEEFTEQYYNRCRLHSVLRYRSPEGFERAAQAKSERASAAAIDVLCSIDDILDCR
jgi:transposase InsO family protein